MSKKIIHSSLGLSIGIKNSKSRFKGFHDGLPVFEIFDIEEIEEISIVDNPAFGQYLTITETINDGKDDIIEIYQPRLIDITKYLFKPKKLTLEEQKKFELEFKDKVFISDQDKYGSVLSVDGYKFYIYGNEHFVKGKPHLHVIHDGENINFRMDFNGNYLNTEKGCNGMNRKIKKIIKEIFKPFLNTKIAENDNKTGKEILIEAWNTNNPNLKI